MTRKAKSREAEQRYFKRARGLAAMRQKKTRGYTPWKTFFAAGVGASIETTIAETSITAIVNTYGKRLGKRFTCSYERKEDKLIIVKIVAVKRRENET